MLIETFLPLARRPMRHARRIARMVVRPFFTGYLFARFCVTDSLRAVAYSRGVIRVLGTRGQPLAVDDAIIASLRERLDSDDCIEFCNGPLAVGDAVRITSGPLRGWSGVFERQLSDDRRVEILIETLQHGRLVVWRELLAPMDRVIPTGGGWPSLRHLSRRSKCSLLDESRRLAFLNHNPKSHGSSR
jgi:transcriptional antiterminator RfaH